MKKKSMLLNLSIRFMQEMKNAGFNATYCLTLVQNKNFYSGQKQDGIYVYFRGQELIHGLINKPTGKEDEHIIISGEYEIA